MILKESIFRCPVCHGKLFIFDKYIKCMKNHTYDISKHGYYNLLMSNASGKRHGDDKLMVEARRDFLNKGYYEKLKVTLNDIVGDGHTLLDSGCGEGYYTSIFAEKNKVCGIDISKDALKLASKFCHSAEFAVASIADIPLADNSVDTTLNIFAPDSPDEFLRVLKNGGRLITVYPMENHLLELKQAVYDTPYLNPSPVLERKDMTLKEKHTLSYSINLSSNSDIVSLFKMTPYYYKTSKEDQAKLDNLNNLTVTAQFMIAEHVK
ncbi:MAG: methyltransferase domain-containing protein [Acutalibacteraceae bacterium]|nr:methyltransferase domain-containing protein [Acutalibacteraceae bacterium]